MKIIAFVILAVGGALLSGAPSANAQSSPREAADMLHALNIQIGQAQRAGDLKRVSQLQNRYMQIQKEWGVRPTDHSQRPEPPIARPRNWSITENGSGKITGYRGGNIRLRRAGANFPSFWQGDGTPRDGGREASLKFTDIDGNDYVFNGSWSYRGNRVVTLRLIDERGRPFSGTLTMAREGFSTVNLVGEGRADGCTVSFVD